MFKNLGSWLGIEHEKVEQRSESAADVEDQKPDINKPSPAAESEQTNAGKEDVQPAQLLQKAKGFSGKF